MVILGLQIATPSQWINNSTWNSNLNPYSTWNSNLSLVYVLSLGPLMAAENHLPPISAVQCSIRVSTLTPKIFRNNCEGPP